MNRYTFTDDCGTREHRELATDAEAIEAARAWADGGEYHEPTEIALWHEDRLVVSFTV